MKINNKKRLLRKAPPGGVVAIILLCLMTVSVPAQMASENAAIGISGPVGGGGTSSSDNYGLTGLIPIGAPGIASGDDYITYGGPVAVLYSGLTIEYAGETSVPAGANYLLKVGCRGGPGTPAGVVHYRSGGTTIWINSAMAVVGDTLTAAIPAAQLTIRGIELWFEVDRGSYHTAIGSAGEPFYLQTQLTNAQAQTPTATPAGRYRIISLPVQAAANGVENVFPDDLGAANAAQWRLGSFDPGSGTVDEYPDAADVIPGRGYWLITRNADTYGAAGLSVCPPRGFLAPDAVELAVDSGWNLIASPYPFNIAWEDVYFRYGTEIIPDHPDTLLEDVIYSYTGTTYQEVVTLTPWNGVFVLIKKDGFRMVFPYHESTGTLKTTPEITGLPVAVDFWTVSLNLKSGRFTDQDNYIGVRPDALDGPDKYDFSEPPAAPESPWLAVRLPLENGHLRRSDFRAPLKEGATWVLEIAPGTNRVLTIGNVAQIPSHMEGMLVLENGRATDIYDNMDVALPDNVRSARLIIGVREYTTQEISSILPREYSLGQNYPNPFNPITTIRFDLPAAGRVVLDVYNVLGQKVKTLVDEHRTAGFHTAVWNGTDYRGVPVASGVYFYRMEAGDYSSYRKMLLLK